MPRRRTAESMERDARAYDLFRRGLSYRQISNEFGWISPNAAFQAVRRGAKEAALDSLEAVAARQAFLDRLQDYRRAAQRVMNTRHYMTTQAGKLVLGPDGQPLLDDDFVLKVIDRLLKVDDTEARLLDLYPAAKTRVEVINEDQLDAECARMLKEIEDREAAAAAADSGTA